MPWTHFQLHNVPPFPMGLYFHSETSPTFQCSSDKHWRILQHHLGQQRPRRLFHIQCAHKIKHRLVKGKNTKTKTENWTWDAVGVHYCVYLLTTHMQICFWSFLIGSSFIPFSVQKVHSIRPQETGTTYQIYCGCSGHNVPWESLSWSMEWVEFLCRIEDWRHGRTR